MLYCASVVLEILHSFRGSFTAPGHQHFVRLMVGWVLLEGRHTISRVLLVTRQLGSTVHHASVYRFFSQGRWSADSLGRTVVGMLGPWLSDRVVTIVDDTLCEKSGRQLFGVAIHFDSARSSYDRQGRRVDVCTPGHNWVVLAVHVRCPWNLDRGWAIPVLWRLYRAPRRCPPSEYRKRNELAVEMIAILAGWLGEQRHLYVTGDTAYCCKTVLRNLPPRVHFVGPLPSDAALYTTDSRSSLRGRPRRKGYRVANPSARLAQRKGFKRHVATLYEREVTVELSSFVCIWYPSAGNDPVRVVIVRDPKGKDGRAYVSTDADLSPVEILSLYALRWRLEVTFRDLKQHLGLEDPRNGWWRRPAGQRDDPCRPPLRPAQHSGQVAVERTTPFAGCSYAVVVCWYLAHGSPQRDVDRAKSHAPWYTRKRHATFQDMLCACRRALWMDHFCRMRLPRRLRQMAQTLVEASLIAA